MLLWAGWLSLACCCWGMMHVLCRRCKETGESKVILTTLCGHGHFDMSSYAKYLDGGLQVRCKEIWGEVCGKYVVEIWHPACVLHELQNIQARQAGRVPCPEVMCSCHWNGMLGMC